MIHLYISGSNSIWIGGWDKNNDDVLYWMDRTRVSGYTNWNIGSGEPDGGSRENYLGIRKSSQWRWFDWIDMEYAYLCEVAVN